MGKFFRYFIFLAVFVVNACASSQQADESDPATTALSQGSASDNQVARTEQTNDEELICRNEVVTGSNFRRRVCRTRAQTREENQQTQEILDIRRAGTTSQ